jgi:hypothetical protein
VLVVAIDQLAHADRKIWSRAALAFATMYTVLIRNLGYSFMSVSTLFAAFVFTGAGVERAARWFLIANVSRGDWALAIVFRRAPAA